MKPMRLSNSTQQGLVIALPFIFTLFLRLPLVGGPPFTDECYYAFRGELFSSGAKASEFAPIELYSAIAITLAGMPENTPLLHLRIFDAFVAAAASAAMGLFLRRWTSFLPALTMAIGWALAANDPEYAQAGFRNPIMAATFVFVGALALLSGGARWSSFVSGLLIPAAPLLRELFVMVPIISIYLATALRGRKGFQEHLAGLIVGGMLQLAWIVPMRGSPATILGYYSDRKLALNKVEYIRDFVPWDHVKLSLEIFLKHSSWFLIPAILGLICLVPARKPRTGRFWVVAGLALLLPISHLYEIFGMMGKRVTSYHWSQLLVTAAFLGAIGLHRTNLLARAKGVEWASSRLYIGLALAALLIGPAQMFRDYRQAWRLSKQFAPVMVSGRWDHPVVQKSFYLALAKILRDHASPTDRVLISGHFPIAAYSLTGLYPINKDIIDIERFQSTKYYQRRPDLLNLLREHPPIFLVEGFRKDSTPQDFKKAWFNFDERFELIETIPLDSPVHYGNFGARIYRLLR